MRHSRKQTNVEANGVSVDPAEARSLVLNAFTRVRSSICILHVDIAWRSGNLPDLQKLEKDFRTWVDQLPKWSNFYQVQKFQKRFERSSIDIRPFHRMHNSEKCIRNFIITTELNSAR